MKTSKMALSFALIGLFIIVVGTIKYYFIQDEIFRPLVCAYVGMSIIFNAYCYNWFVQSQKSFERLQLQADAIGAELFKQTDEARRELILGADRHNLTGIVKGLKEIQDAGPGFC